MGTQWAHWITDRKSRELTISPDWWVGQPPAPQTGIQGSVWNRPRRLAGAQDGLNGQVWMKLVTSHLTSGNPSRNDCLGILEHAFPAVLPVGVQNGEELYFDATRVLDLFKKKNYKAPMGIWIKSNPLRPSVSIFNTGAEPNLCHTSLTPLKWSKLICALQNISRMSI